MTRTGRASSTLVPSTNSHKNNINYMNKIWHIALTNSGEIVVEAEGDEESIVFPPDITRLLYYSMCTFYNNKSKLC